MGCDDPEGLHGGVGTCTTLRRAREEDERGEKAQAEQRLGKGKTRGKGGASSTGVQSETRVGGLGSTGNDSLRSQNPVSNGEPLNVLGPRIMSSMNISINKQKDFGEVLRGNWPAKLLRSPAGLWFTCSERLCVPVPVGGACLCGTPCPLWCGLGQQ